MNTTAAAAEAVPEQQQQISDFGRVIGVLTNPGATFADIVRKPKWILPVVLLCALGAAVGVVMNQKMDWRSFFTQQMEKSGRADQIPAERKATILSAQTKWAPLTAPFFAPIAIVCLTLIISLVYLLAFNVMAGAATKFKTALGIVAHAQLPHLISSPIAMIVVYLKEYGDVDPEHLLATSVASFLPNDAPHWLSVLGGSFEVFSVWSLALMGVGFAATNPKRVSVAKGLGIVFGVWLIWVFVRTSIAAL